MGRSACYNVRNNKVLQLACCITAIPLQPRGGPRRAASTLGGKARARDAGGLAVADGRVRIVEEIFSDFSRKALTNAAIGGNILATILEWPPCPEWIWARGLAFLDLGYVL